MDTVGTSDPDRHGLIDLKRFRIMSSALGENTESVLADLFVDCENFKIGYQQFAAMGDAASIANLCHEIKGAVAMLGLSGLQQCFQSWEKAAAGGNIPAPEEILREFDQVLSRTRSVIPLPGGVES
jgi:HPt (histidine-containing phosphotransfer) domain-containing protein